MKNQPKSRKTSLLCLTLVLTLIVSLFVGCGASKEETGSEAASSQSDVTEDNQNNGDTTSDTLTDIAGYGSNTATALDSYAVLEAAPNDANMSHIVAINGDSEACLTNGELQIYYWIEFYNFMNSYGAYASMFGLDTNSPLDQQASMQEGSTWEQYFLEAAALHYNENYALAQAAYAGGYTISDEDAANLADMDDPDGNFAAEATEYGYESVEAYIQANFGNGVSVEDYKNYLRTYYAAYDYYTSQKENYELSLSDEDIEAYYDENVETFEEQGLAKVNNIQVRHILIGVEGETDENGEYSADAWAAAEETANDLYKEWLTNPTEDYFAELANAHSTDPGSNTGGGLYDDVYPGQMVETFNDWCFDENRAIGDHGIVETDYGYHIMFFVGVSENRQWFISAQEDMISVHMNDFLDEIIEQYPLKYDYTKVRIYDMISNSVVAE